ncbi:YdeI/OmpD-associated family protein [Sphingobacterium hungaricum]
MDVLFFATASSFRNWLTQHHGSETELYVGFYKIGSGKESITWSEAVDQALCFGWIDGRKDTLDPESYSIRFTPRKKNSIWSAINIRKVEQLTEAGLMREAGLKAYALRDENKDNSYYHEAGELSLEASQEKLFKKNRSAWNYFSKQAPSYKKTVIHWITSAKQDKTKAARLEKAILESKEKRRLNV